MFFFLNFRIYGLKTDLLSFCVVLFILQLGNSINIIMEKIPTFVMLFSHVIQEIINVYMFDICAFFFLHSS